MDQIRIGIVGYGNLGCGVEYALRQNPDMALVGVFTRRPPSSLTLQTPGVPVYPLDALDGMEGAVDVLLLCGGDKRKQNADIDRACAYWRDWQQRTGD